ncbi:radical SAM protein [candidate division WOR-3 bacterium]|nr:radical SAM protein [candidate division WOR-3 bacterium]
MVYTYGPVPSRRLGLSLGVDVLPYKTCSLDCIYCQLGRTSNLAVERNSFFPREEILAEVITVASETNPAYVTFSGSGEPTLNSDTGWLIREIKSKSGRPVAVLTNSSLLWMPEVREEIKPADLVVPSLDAATEEVWKKLNRPHPDLDFSKVIEGLIDFSNEYAGQLWVEILMVKGMNDSAEHVKALNRILARMRFDKVQLNTVVRPPSEESALALSYEELRAISKELSVNTEIIVPYRKKGKQVSAHGDRERILAAIARRPMTVKQIEQSLGIPPERSKPALEALVAEGKAKPSIHEGETFYEAVR